MILLQYFLKLSVSLAMIYLFYNFILRRLTFYHHNRWYLAGYSLLCFFIALININPLLERNQLLDNKLVNAFPTVHDLAPDAGDAVVAANSQWNIWNWMMLIFFFGFLLLVIRLIVQYISFRLIKSNAELLSDGLMKLYQVNKTIIPFSFGNSIFINQSQHEEEELKEIIRHEFVHVKQKHTIDIIWSELLCALNWFNPFAWLIRKAIRQNLEFIADNNVLESGMDKKQYQYLLLKVIGISQFSIANQFNFSSLKKRIAMMNKIKTAKVQLIKSLFVLPIIAMLLLAFRSHIHDRANAPDKTIVLDSIPKNKAVDISLHRSDAMDEVHQAFFDRNLEVQLLHWKKNGTLEIYLTNDRVEKYSPQEIKMAETKYGKLPAKAEGSHGETSLINETVPEQTIPNEKGYLIDIKDRDGHCTIVIRDKDKKPVKEIDLLKWNGDRETYEEMYGEVPAVPVTSVIAVTAPLTMAYSEQPLTAEVAGSVPVTVIGHVQNTVVSKISTTNIPTEVRVVPGVALTASGPVEVRGVTGSNLPVTVQGFPQQAVPVETVIAGVPAGEKIMELKIYRSSKKADLNQLISQAKTNGVELVFDDIKYNDKDQLVAISGELKKGEEKGSFNASDFFVVRLLLYKVDGHFSIRIMVSDKGEMS
jgi:hypothetical protein